MNKEKNRNLYLTILFLCFLCVTFSTTERDSSSVLLAGPPDAPSYAEGIGSVTIHYPDSPSVYAVIKEKFNCSDSMIYISDRHYECVSDDAFMEFLANDQTDSIPYQPETFDCDDYALHLLSAFRMHCSRNNMNAAIGMAWVDDHAVTFYINSSYSVNIIDPHFDTPYLMENESAYFVYI